MIAFRRAARALQRLLAYLPCSVCAAPGPHLPVPTPGGGYEAACAACHLNPR